MSPVRQGIAPDSRLALVLRERPGVGVLRSLIAQWRFR
jgi:hypothetical protein